jgi:hypothetical protein
VSFLSAYVDARLAEEHLVETGRRRALDGLAASIAARLRASGSVDLVFVCTHNSRRSHLAQVWAQAAADRLGVAGVRTWSGGTEATAFDPRAVAALRRAGFRIEAEGPGANPVQRVWIRDGGEPLRCWSKRFLDPPNPRTGFVAIMTCSSADAECPVVAGAASRAAIPYDDPKAFDGTPREAEAYDERCTQIAREMLYLLGRVAAGA